MKVSVSGLQSILERLKFYEENVNLNLQNLKKVYNSFKYELQKGLELHKLNPTEFNPDLCSLKMLDSFVPSLTTGDETGVYYALDFGGSFLRSVRVNLKGEGKIETDYNIYSLHSQEDIDLPKGLLDPLAPGHLLFDRLVKQTRRIMESYGDHNSAKPFPVGFTCSFPCMQKGLACSELIEWTKEFETGHQTPESPVVNQDVGHLLNMAYIRGNVPGKVTAVINDTVGTLLSCSYQKPKSYPQCMIGLILGTGCNACYVEPNWKSYSYEGKIINIEFGNFNKDLPICDIDFQLDYHAANPGKQLFEKLVSGCYMGEMCRIATIRVLEEYTPAKAWIQDSLTSSDVATIALDEAQTFLNTFNILKKNWDAEFPYNILEIIHKIALMFLGRSAALAACAISAIADHIWESNTDSLTCGVDGSLYIKNIWYQKEMRKYIDQILENNPQKLYLSPADDGSGKGAALIAAIADLHSS